MPDEYYGDRYRELNTQLAKRERSTKRKSRESLAARGALHSGMTSTTERAIEGQIGEEFTAGARDIEDRRWRAGQDQIARQHQTSEREGSQLFQTGEREGSQLFATGEREGTQSWQSGENEATRGIQLELQKMSDAARYELQQLVQSGQMTLQEAEQKWASYESDLARELEWRTSEGQWQHEADRQKYASGQEQWMAQFGAEAAMSLQMNANNFDAMMAHMGRDWELADRSWEEQMFLMDAQLQMLVSGYDWTDDDIVGGQPLWMTEGYNEKEGFNLGYGSGSGSGSATGDDWWAVRNTPYEDLTPYQQELWRQIHNDPYRQ